MSAIACYPSAKEKRTIEGAVRNILASRLSQRGVSHLTRIYHSKKASAAIAPGIIPTTRKYVARFLPKLLVSIFLILFAAEFTFPRQHAKIEEPVDLFPQVSGWRIAGAVESFVGTNLYNRIDGAADLYLSYGCQELHVAQYIGPDSASLVLEVYRHGTPLHAFGIYSRERPRRAKYLKIGVQGYIEAPILNFVVGNAYVKINSYGLGRSADKTLQTFARNTAGRLGGTRTFPSVLSSFPRTGKRPNSETFIARSFLGYEFFHSGFLCDYSRDKRSFQLFVIVGDDTSDCRSMLSQYSRQINVTPMELKEGTHTFSDPYQGELTLSWKGRFIWGALRLEDKVLRSDYLREMGKLLGELRN